jgi:hypothetical protein
MFWFHSNCFNNILPGRFQSNCISNIKPNIITSNQLSNITPIVIAGFSSIQLSLLSNACSGFSADQIAAFKQYRSYVLFAKDSLVCLAGFWSTEIMGMKLMRFVVSITSARKLLELLKRFQVLQLKTLQKS